jgi:hypothetical protein
MAMSKKRRNAILGTAAVAAVGLLLWRMRGSTRSSTMPPPPPRPGELVPDIAYQAGGESQLSLPVGTVFRVVWDPLSPWSYAVQDTDDVEAASVGDGFVQFRMARALPKGGVSQVFVIASDENNNVLSEHKVTVFGP